MRKTIFRYFLFVCLVCLWSYLQAEFVIETRQLSSIILSDQMHKFDEFIHPYNLPPEERLPWQINAPTHRLLQKIQHFRQQQLLDSLIVDTTLCRAATFHNQEMLDYNYRSTDFEKDRLPYQGLFLYLGPLNDYTSYSFVLGTTNLAEMEQQFFSHDSLRQILQNPLVNCIGLAINEGKSGYLCTIYLSERYLFFEGSGYFGGALNSTMSYWGTTALSSFTLRVYYHPVHPKRVLKLKDIDTSNPLQEITVIPKSKGKFEIAVRYPIGPTRVLVYYDEQNRPIALGYNPGVIQQKYYINEDGTKHYLDAEGENQPE